MAVRTGHRLVVRLDDAYRAKLRRIVEARGGTVSDFLRDAIDREYARLVASGAISDDVRPSQSTGERLSNDRSGRT